MFLVGLILLAYAAATFAIFERASRPLITWMPGAHAQGTGHRVDGQRPCA